MFRKLIGWFLTKFELIARITDFSLSILNQIEFHLVQKFGALEMVSVVGDLFCWNISCNSKTVQ